MLRVLAEHTDSRSWPHLGSLQRRRNFPMARFTGPIETETTARCGSRSRLFSGREVEDVRLRLDGRVVQSGRLPARAAPTDAHIDEGASILGEFAIGSYAARTSKQIPFDEKIAAPATWRSAPVARTGSTNRSGLHWDMVCDLRSGEIHADGELIYRDGRFLPEFAPDLSPPQG